MRRAVLYPWMVVAAIAALFLLDAATSQRGEASPVPLSRGECVALLGGQCNDAVNCATGDPDCTCAEQGCNSTGCTVTLGTLCINQNGECIQANKRCQGVCGQQNDVSPDGCLVALSNKERCVLVEHGPVPPDPDTCAGKCTLQDRTCGSFYQRCSNVGQ